jgi:hypothetical protein
MLISTCRIRMHSLQAFRFIKMNDSVKMASKGGLEFHLTKAYEPVLHTYAPPTQVGISRDRPSLS